VTEQHPSLEGDDAGVVNEVEQRSADGADGQVFKKTIRGVIHLELAQDPENVVHNDNKLAVLQEAIQRGLHPKEEPHLLSAEVFYTNRRGQTTVDMVYGVEVEPAVIDEDNTETTVEPAEMLADMGGTTRPDNGGVEEDPRVARHARRTREV
jgi:hypothetical protein